VRHYYWSRGSLYIVPLKSYTIVMASLSPVGIASVSPPLSTKVA
jgi:hypothetical protein